MNKAPYYLVIQTDRYTGNFVREVVGFCIGVLRNKKDVTEYTKAFWNGVAAPDINSIEQYKQMEDEFIKNYLSSETILEQMNFRTNKRIRTLKTLEDAEAYRLRYIEKMKDNKLIKFFEEELCYTLQWVDDIKEYTFYNIACSDKGKNNYADLIYIQLNRPLDKEMEEIIIPRIKTFFRDNVLQIVEPYIHLCHAGKKQDCLNCNESANLLEVKLVDENGEVKKVYKL